jgi:hypothetical protein
VEKEWNKKEKAKAKGSLGQKEAEEMEATILAGEGTSGPQDGGPVRRTSPTARTASPPTRRGRQTSEGVCETGAPRLGWGGSGRLGSLCNNM